MLTTTTTAGADRARIEVSPGLRPHRTDLSAEHQSFIDALARTLAPVMAKFAQYGADSMNGFGGASALLEECTADVLNEQQRDVPAQLEMRLAT